MIKKISLIIGWVICATWLILSVNQTMTYEFGVNDCSNMVFRAEQFFDSVGIETMIGEQFGDENISHVWIIICAFGFEIPFETTTLMPAWDYKPDRIFQNTSVAIDMYPYLANEYCEGGK